MDCGLRLALGKNVRPPRKITKATRAGGMAAEDLPSTARKKEKRGLA
jgi:hypothetical protein